MQLNIEHRTRLAFDTPVDYTIQQLHLTPQDGFGQRVKRWEIRVSGQIHQHADPYGNTAHTLVVDTPHREIEITALGEVETGLDTLPANDALPLQIYLRSTPLTMPSKELITFAENFRAPSGGVDTVGLQSLIHAIRERVRFEAELEQGAFTYARDAFTAGVGTGQDLAQIFIACCRQLGLPARYVSGYRFEKDGNLMHSHGWADVWLDDEWQSHDIAYGQRANGIHVRLATGLDARDACPISQFKQRTDSSLSSRINAQSLVQSQQ